MKAQIEADKKARAERAAQEKASRKSGRVPGVRTRAGFAANPEKSIARGPRFDSESKQKNCRTDGGKDSSRRMTAHKER